MKRWNEQQHSDHGHEIIIQQNIDVLSTMNTNITYINTQTKKTKKLSRNRRKKQKIKQKQLESRNALEIIIKNIYGLKTTYQKDYHIINQLLNVDLHQDRFYEFINKVIREQVNQLSQQIHGYTQNICKHYHRQPQINQQQITQLKHLIQIVKQASVQLQKIINLFVIKIQQISDMQHLHNNLDLSTLRYIIESDPFKDDFQFCCCNFVNDNAQHQSTQAVQDVIRNFKIALEYVDYNQSNQSNQEIEYHDEYQEYNKKKKKKRRQQKKEQQKRKLMILHQQIQIANDVIQYLSKMTIYQEERRECWVEEQWVMKFKERREWGGGDGGK